MNLEALVAVSGMQGLYKVVGNRSNGLIIEDLDTGKRKFAPARVHQFSPLESISIYTYQDATPLKDIFAKMKATRDTNPPVPFNAPNDELADYFRSIVNDYDEDKVKISDIKKVIRWFEFLNDRKLLEVTGSDEEE
jgi:hypothetical protein